MHSKLECKCKCMYILLFQYPARTGYGRIVNFQYPAGSGYPAGYCYISENSQTQAISQDFGPGGGFGWNWGVCLNVKNFAGCEKFLYILI